MIDAQLQLAGQVTSVIVSESVEGQLVDPAATGTRTELNRSTMERMPIAPSNRGLEAMLLSFPGFAANANGAIHPRGAHNQMTYVVDGMPIGDQLTGAFANAVDPAVVQTLELYTGNVPAEFGGKVSGVAVITTRTGLGMGRRFSGSTQLSGGGFDTLGSITQIAGGAEKWGYFASFNALKSNRYLDQVSIDNLHNGGNSERAFARIDGQVSPVDNLRLNLMAGRSSFQLANLRSQHATGQDQRQAMQDGSVSVGWVRTLNSAETIDTTVSFRTATARLLPSPHDTPVTAAQDRRLSTFTAGSRWNRLRGRHNWRAGVDIQRFPLRERFTYGFTTGPDTRLNHFEDQATGGMYTGFVQDSLRLGNLQLTLGLRYDNYRFLITGDQWQPRVGAAYHITQTNTVLRASYNRTYQTPPNENLLLSSTGRAVIPIRPERQNVFEAGLQQSFGRHLSLTAAGYHKNSRDMQDNDNFLNTGIIFPISLARSRTNGFEARLTVLPVRGLSGSLSITHLHTVVTPPFTGGLFLGSAAVSALSAGPFIIDHDQPLGLSGLVQYNITRRIWVSGSVRYDSGLVANPSDPERVAADPDYSDLLPYVNLLSNPARVRPRTVTDVAFGYEAFRGERRQWDLMVQVANVGGVTALYNFQSIFVGTRMIQPRTASVKLRFWF
jgi:outer membrane cobalamin receptor